MNLFHRSRTIGRSALAAALVAILAARRAVVDGRRGHPARAGLAGLDDPLYVDERARRQQKVCSSWRLGRRHQGCCSPAPAAEIFSTSASACGRAGGSEQGLLVLALSSAVRVERAILRALLARRPNATVVGRVPRLRRQPERGGYRRGPSSSPCAAVHEPQRRHGGVRPTASSTSRRATGARPTSGNRAQNVDELLGKILSTVDHPSGGNAYRPRPVIRSSGRRRRRRDLRLGCANPWRFSFDRLTGRALRRRRGQGAREENQHRDRGGNYGCECGRAHDCKDLGPAPCTTSVRVPDRGSTDTRRPMLGHGRLFVPGHAGSRPRRVVRLRELLQRRDVPVARRRRPDPSHGAQQRLVRRGRSRRDLRRRAGRHGAPHRQRYDVRVHPVVHQPIGAGQASKGSARRGRARRMRWTAAQQRRVDHHTSGQSGAATARSLFRGAKRGKASRRVSGRSARGPHGHRSSGGLLVRVVADQPLGTRRGIQRRCQRQHAGGVCGWSAVRSTRRGSRLRARRRAPARDRSCSRLGDTIRARAPYGPLTIANRTFTVTKRAARTASRPRAVPVGGVANTPSRRSALADLQMDR